MTLEEKSRAKRLEKLSRVYEKHIITRRTVLTVTIVIMALLYALWLFVDVGGYIPSTHVFFAVLIMGLYSNDNVGDGGVPNGIDIGLPITGSSGTGAFFCTLPFEAKDILRMRLRRFEIQLAFINIVAVITQILFILIYGGVPLQSGFCTALILLAELLYMVTIFIRNHQVKLYSKLTVLVAFVILSCPAFDSDADLYNEALPLMTAFRFLSGWVGIAVPIISPILIAAAGEIYLKNKKDPSWHLK